VEELRELVNVQARLVRPLLFDDHLLALHLSSAGPEAPSVSLPDIEEQLLARLDIPSENGRWPCFRANVIVAHRLFPPEWRYEACSTFLPADARATVARWRKWYAEVTAGRMRHYLRRLAIQEASRLLEDTQTTLLERVSQTMSKTNAWARTERFQHACAKALALPRPPATLPVGAPPDADTDAPTLDQDQQLDALTHHIAWVNDAVRGFNRSVPAPCKVSYAEQVSIDTPTSDPWLESFFSWMVPSLQAGYGLYLWA
jgi:hypothetical protein